MATEISLIVCSRNRGPQLKGTLESVARQDFSGSWELILVDNGSTDNTPEVIADFVASTTLAVKAVTEPLPGLARARNRGLSHATGRIVCFTDDDCYPEADYLTAIVRCFAEENVAFCGGRLMLYDPDDLRVTIQERPFRTEITPYSFVPTWLIHGANMAFLREDVLRLRGFDERLGVGSEWKSAEDTDLLRRFAAAGLRGVYDPRIVVHHHHGRKQLDDVEKLKHGYWIGAGACMIKYILNPSTRMLYLRNWYWLMRKVAGRQVYTEIRAAVSFLMSNGMSRSRLWSHPADCLELRSGK